MPLWSGGPHLLGGNKHIADSKASLDDIISNASLFSTLANEFSGLSEELTPSNGDLITLESSVDGSKKKAQISNLPSGGSGGGVTSVDTFTANSWALTTGSWQGFGNYVVPANQLSTNHAIMYEWYGYASFPSDTSITAHTRIQFGSTNVCELQDAYTASNNILWINYRAFLANNDATNAQRLTSTTIIMGGNNQANGIAKAIVGTSAEDTTSNLTMQNRFKAVFSGAGTLYRYWAQALLIE